MEVGYTVALSYVVLVNYIKWSGLRKHNESALLYLVVLHANEFNAKISLE